LVLLKYKIILEEIFVTTDGLSHSLRISGRSFSTEIWRQSNADDGIWGCILAIQ